MTANDVIGLYRVSVCIIAQILQDLSHTIHTTAKSLQPCTTDVIKYLQKQTNLHSHSVLCLGTLKIS